MWYIFYQLWFWLLFSLFWDLELLIFRQHLCLVQIQQSLYFINISTSWYSFLSYLKALDSGISPSLWTWAPSYNDCNAKGVGLSCQKLLCCHHLHPRLDPPSSHVHTTSEEYTRFSYLEVTTAPSSWPWPVAVWYECRAWSSLPPWTFLSSLTSHSNCHRPQLARVLHSWPFSFPGMLNWKR